MAVVPLFSDSTREQVSAIELCSPQLYEMKVASSAFKFLCKRLRHFPCLRRLNIVGMPVYGEGLAALARHPSLEALELKCNLDPPILRQITKSRSLKSLTLVVRSLDVTNSDYLIGLGGSDTLEYLQLGFDGLLEKPKSEIGARDNRKTLEASLQNFTVLKSFKCRSLKKDTLNALVSLPALECLDIGSTDPALLEVPMLRIKRFHTCYCTCAWSPGVGSDPHGGPISNIAVRLPNLRTLDIRGSSFMPEQLLELAKFDYLETIVLDSGMARMLEVCPRMKSLRALVFGNEPPYNYDGNYRPDMVLEWYLLPHKCRA